MKRLLLLAFLLVLLNGCASQPPYIDNGHPGQIKVVAFYDDNRNGVMDATEAGYQSQAAISQEVSCPPTGKPDWKNMEASGVYTFEDLKPGKYCVLLDTSLSSTTRLAWEAYVSSDQVTTVPFGVVRP